MKSMSKTKIYHNNKCSKSRACLALLEKQVPNHEVIYYLDTPPSIEELDYICLKLNVEPQAIIRHKEKVFSELGLTLKDALSRTEWLTILHKNPILLERPIVIHKDKAAIARPIENVTAIL